MSSVLVVAEQAAGELGPATAKCLTAAAAIGAERVDVLVAAEPEAAAPAQAAALEGVAQVFHLELDGACAVLAAALAPEAAALARDYTHVLGPSTTFGKDLMPRVAALLGVGQLSDIMAVEHAYRFERPTYAGNAIVTVEAPDDRILVATVRLASFKAAAAGGEAAPIEAREPGAPPPEHTRYVGLEADTAGGRPDLATAARVVAGGRGVKTAERFAEIERLADILGAALGASRAAVDSGLAPNDLQVGQTGKIIAPRLYIAIGISGAIQHLTGIKDAETIVAINNDPEAPIFDVADIGLVADLEQAVPELIETLAGR